MYKTNRTTQKLAFMALSNSDIHSGFHGPVDSHKTIWNEGAVLIVALSILIHIPLQQRN